MTPERRKYLASISKEERAIRELIENSKRTIKHYKILMNEDKEDTEYINDVGKPQIAIRKFLIKELKKALPAPRHEQYDYISDSSWLDCSCGRGVYPTQPYCMWCGQKLR